MESRKELLYSSLFNVTANCTLDYAIYTSMSMDRQFWRYLLEMQAGFSLLKPCKLPNRNLLYGTELKKTVFFRQYDNLDWSTYDQMDGLISKRIYTCSPPLGDCFHPKVAILRYLDENNAPFYRIGVFSKNLTNGNDDEAGIILDGKLTDSPETNQVQNGQQLVNFLSFLKKSTIAPSDEKKLTEIIQEVKTISLTTGGKPAGIFFGGLTKKATSLYDSMGNFWTSKEIHVITKPEFVGDSFRKIRKNPENGNITFYNHEKSTHAKIFLTENEFWIGSANCSEMALGCDPQKANVECLVQVCGIDKDEILKSFEDSGYTEFTDNFPNISSENQNMLDTAVLEEFKKNYTLSCKTERKKQNKQSGNEANIQRTISVESHGSNTYTFSNCVLKENTVKGNTFLIVPLESFPRKSSDRPKQTTVTLTTLETPTPYAVVALLDRKVDIIATTVMDLVDSYFKSDFALQIRQNAIESFLTEGWFELLKKNTTEIMDRASQEHTLLLSQPLDSILREKINQKYADIYKLKSLSHSKTVHSQTHTANSATLTHALGLKDFQKRATEHVVFGFNHRDKMLVSDETGLGKTHISLGVIAEMAEEWFRANQKATHFNVIYVCSNQRISHVNTNRLYDDLGKLSQNTSWGVKKYDTDRASRLNDSKVTCHIYPDSNMKDSKSKFINIYAFSSNILDTTNSKEGNDAERAHIMKQLELTEAQLRENFEEKRENTISKAIKDVPPQLMILDEFHRFWNKKGLIDNYFKDCKKLYLSATPYVMNIKGLTLKSEHLEDFEDDQEGTSGCESFEEMVRYFVPKNEAEKIINAHHAHQKSIALLSNNATPENWNCAKKCAETLSSLLITFLYRNERAILHDSVDDTKDLFADSFSLPHFNKCYDAYQVDAKPSYQNLMPGIHSFALKYYNEKGEKNRDEDARKKARYVSLFPSELDTLPSNPDVIVNSSDYFIDLENRLQENLPMNQILQANVEGAEQLLWVPASKPYYKAMEGKVFAKNQGYTKMFVFSNYKFIPRGVGALISGYVDEKNSKTTSPFAPICTVDEIADKPTLQKLANLFNPKDKIWEGLNCQEIFDYLKKLHPDRNDDAIWLSLGSPQVVAYRMFGDFDKANKVLEIFNQYFKKDPIKRALEHSGYDSTLAYSADGNIQAVLEEFLFLCNGDSDHFLEKLAICCGLKPSKIHLLYDKIDLSSKNPVEKDCHFAERFDRDFGDVNGNTSDADQREVALQAAFNSPFLPMVMASTSVAQEGLDFHCYCHRMMHYTLPKTPMAFEQRDGRVDRYHSHLLRHRLGYDNRNQDWKDIFGGNGISPHWKCHVGHSNYYLERLCPRFPASHTAYNYEQLMEFRRLYRSFIGMPNEISMVKKLIEVAKLLNEDLFHVMPHLMTK